jgi:hypothetical protein
VPTPIRFASLPRCARLGPEAEGAGEAERRSGSLAGERIGPSSAVVKIE